MRWAAVALMALLSSVGCSQTVTGSAGPATRAVTILPTESEITSSVGNTLSTFGFRPFVGNVEILPDGYRTDADASPIACVAVTDTAPRVVYEAVPVIEAARQSYFNWDEGVDTSGADAAVMRFSTVAAARAAFDSFAREWRQCDDGTVVKRTGPQHTSEVEAKVSRVTETDTVLSATIRTRPRPEGSAALYERAIGVRADTIVEVSLAVKPEVERQSPSPAIRTVELMLDKVAPAR
jgi:hypothetical protein